jgi:adenine-specific DNA-methyltransferase
VLVDDLMRRTEADEKAADPQPDLFADFNGFDHDAATTEFYQHDANWTNRIILGDGLQVMASLAEREGMRGKVQCIYLDPPYGIRFNSNFQWSTTTRDVTNGKVEHITREPEQVKAFRDTWRDGIHSYLTYLRDRLTVARDLLADSGSIFVQIGDENVHRVLALMDEILGSENFVSLISFEKSTGLGARLLPRNCDYIVWYAKRLDVVKYRQLYTDKSIESGSITSFSHLQLPNGDIRRISKQDIANPHSLEAGTRFLRYDNMMKQGPGSRYSVTARGREFTAGTNWWGLPRESMERLIKLERAVPQGNTLRAVRYMDDFPAYVINSTWTDTGSTSSQKTYVVQTETKVVQRCILMTTDPGDLVLDPTCGSGTTAFVSEQWGRRWITVDTSRVALALARARIMGARYHYYLLSDSREGQLKVAELSRTEPSQAPTRGDIRQGFVYNRVPHITLKSIGNNAEIDVIWDRFQRVLEPLREELNTVLDQSWEEWEIPHEAAEDWPEEGRETHARWWEQRIARQKEIDASITAKADYEYLYDKPYVDNRKVRVAGPFTVESISPHRALGVDENDELIDHMAESTNGHGEKPDFATTILENLKTAGVQQAHREDKISFSAISPWPGELVCAEAHYTEGGEGSGNEKRAAIFVGPEFGTVSRPDLVYAAREAAEADFDVLISCAFNYEAHASEFNKLGRIPVLKARMNADLHMADDLKNTGKGNLFVIFGEPDIDILDAENGQIRVKINGVDVFHPNTGEVRSDGAEGIACWFVDTDYNEESFFVRQAYFLGASDPYKSLKTTLKAEINADAWDTLNSDTSRPFDKPASGRIAVKVINHLGDEVMKVFKV